MWLTGEEERRELAPEYVERLRDVGGVNRYGGNNFRIVWGQTQTDIVGGAWETPTGKLKLTIGPGGRLTQVPETYQISEMRRVLRYDGVPVWFLERWFGPESYGSEFQWYEQNKCPRSGLPLLGPWPAEGDYETCRPLMRSTGEAIEVNDYVIDALIPLILRTHETTEWERRTARQNAREAVRKAENDRRVELYVDRAPIGGPISYAGQVNRTSRVARDRAVSNRVINRLPKKFGQIN